ncbi:MAG: heme-binding protein [Gammaproteobacteria bacterium]
MAVMVARARAVFTAALAVMLIALLGIDSGYAANSNCTGACANSSTFLSVSMVKDVIARAVREAQVRNREATIAVVDRVGNVLAVFQTNGASQNVRITSGRFRNRRAASGQAGLDELQLPIVTLAAIAKAITGAYLSSEGNAFSTRTASQIVQEFFNPGERGQPSGPLFGVQFSQLPCGDLVQQGAPPGIGPRRSPLGLSADPGGLPLYFGGTPVGAIGVVSDGRYSADANIFNNDRDVDEIIALAGTVGLEAPVNRRADRISAGGLLLRFSDADRSDLRADPGAAPPYDDIDQGRAGALVPVLGFFDAPTPNSIQRGRAFGQPESGIEPAKNINPRLFRGLDAFVLSDGNSNNRFPSRTGARNKGRRLTAREVNAVLREGLKIANRARAQIRQPNGSQARVSLSVVDTQGTILGFARTRDAPVFGIDVSLQKARAAAFFTAPDAARKLSRAGGRIRSYVRAAQRFVDAPHRGRLYADRVAFSNRAIGNLARPFFPDGSVSGPTGPLSRPSRNDGLFRIGVNEWSVFNVGLQLDLVAADVLAAATGQARTNCTASKPSLQRRLANGIQIFPGSVPIYKGTTLVGALGISGDGVDQDDMVSFLGVHNAGRALRGRIGNAPKGIRADTVAITSSGETVNLRYVQCPFAPFIGSDEQTPCNGK